MTEERDPRQRAPTTLGTAAIKARGRIDRTGIALVGATLILATGVLLLDRVNPEGRPLIDNSPRKCRM